MMVRSIIKSLHRYKAQILEQGQSCSNGVKNLHKVESLPCVIKLDLFSGARLHDFSAEPGASCNAQLMQ